MRQYGGYLYFTNEAQKDRLAPAHMGFYVTELVSDPLQSGLDSTRPLGHTDAHVRRGLEAGGPGWV